MKTVMKLLKIFILSLYKKSCETSSFYKMSMWTSAQINESIQQVLAISAFGLLTFLAVRWANSPTAASLRAAGVTSGAGTCTEKFEKWRLLDFVFRVVFFSVH